MPNYMLENNYLNMLFSAFTNFPQLSHAVVAESQWGTSKDLNLGSRKVIQQITSKDEL